MNKLKLFNMSALSVKSVKWAFDFGSWQPTESEVLQGFSCIQPEEKERIGRFLFKRDAKASLIGRLLIRKFLAENSSLKYNEIVLKRDDRGKPYVDNPSIKDNINFSVSHHGRLVVFVGHISSVRIGVDVMTAKYQGGKDLSDFFRLMSRHFSAFEWDVIKNTSFSEHIKMMLFNRHWALKESYLKAVGTGITVELKNIEFRVKTKYINTGSYVNDTELYVNGLKQDDWVFQEVLLQSDHLVAVAIQSKNIVDTSLFTFLKYEDLIQNSVPLLQRDEKFCREFLDKDEEPY